LKKFKVVSKKELLRHFRSKQSGMEKLIEKTQNKRQQKCTDQMIQALMQTPAVPLDASMLPPLI
jgi:Skp family chaperone for outer membrane proteins